jgi:hypothetical protein
MVSLLCYCFWMLALVNLTQAAMLAPLVPLSDALALSWSRSTTQQLWKLEYGWVQAQAPLLMAGLLVAGQAVGLSGWLQLFGSRVSAWSSIVSAICT